MHRYHDSHDLAVYDRSPRPDQLIPDLRSHSAPVLPLEPLDSIVPPIRPGCNRETVTKPSTTCPTSPESDPRGTSGRVDNPVAGMLVAMAVPKRTTIGQRSKVYLGLAHEASERAVHEPYTYRRQAVASLVFLALGIALCFWSLTVGLVVILLATFGLVVTPALRRREDRQRRRK